VHDPEKHALDLIGGAKALFPRDKRKAFARRSCTIKNLKRDYDST